MLKFPAQIQDHKGIWQMAEVCICNDWNDYLFIYLFYENLATGGSLTSAILSCHVELSNYSTSKLQKKHK